MAKIHYVWWGNPGTDELRNNAVETPNTMVGAVHGKHEVHYWIGGGAGFNAPLDPRIIQHQIDPTTMLGGTSLVALGSGRFRAVLEKLASFKAFAACKDLVSFAVMFKEGGYFFDTTTVVGEGYHQCRKGDDGKWNPIPGITNTNVARLLAGHPDIRAPYDPAGKGKVLKPGDETGEYVKNFALGAMPGPGTVSATSFDVWSLYSPRAEHPAFKRAVETYVTRAENVGINTPDVLAVGDKKTLTQMMNDENKESRNLLISGLATSSIIDAFYAYCKSSGRQMTDLGWPLAMINKGLMDVEAKDRRGDIPAQPARLNPAGLKANIHALWSGKGRMDAKKIYGGMDKAAVTLPMIGIQKRYAQSWK